MTYRRRFVSYNVTKYDIAYVRNAANVYTLSGLCAH